MTLLLRALSSGNHRVGQSLLRHARCYHELSYASHGDPASVLDYVQLDTSDDDPPSYLEDGLRVEMWHAPLNPADINTIQGKYPSPFSHDSHGSNSGIRQSRFAPGMTVAGSEGWGRVTDVCGQVSGVKVGDVVTVGLPGLGTFRSSFWAPEGSVLVLSQGHELNELLGSQAATIPQLGGTALRMLSDFVTLESSRDVVIQNAGNSGVGFLASQLGRVLFDVPVVSIARRAGRSTAQWDEVVHHLMTVGKCAKVVAEEDLTSRDAVKEFQAELRTLSGTGRLPSLAFNAVGGESASLLCKCLEPGGTMVTFGGMSKKPVTISTSELIFRDLHATGYWHSRWMVQNSLSARQQLVDQLVDAVLRRHVICPPIKEFALPQVHDALHYDNGDSAIRRKVVFRCSE